MFDFFDVVHPRPSSMLDNDSMDISNRFNEPLGSDTLPGDKKSHSVEDHHLDSSSSLDRHRCEDPSAQEAEEEKKQIMLLFHDDDVVIAEEDHSNTSGMGVELCWKKKLSPPKVVSDTSEALVPKKNTLELSSAVSSSEDGVSLYNSQEVGTLPIQEDAVVEKSSSARDGMTILPEEESTLLEPSAAAALLDEDDGRHSSNQDTGALPIEDQLSSFHRDVIVTKGSDNGTELVCCLESSSSPKHGSEERMKSASMGAPPNEDDDQRNDELEKNATPPSYGKQRKVGRLSFRQHVRRTTPGMAIAKKKGKSSPPVSSTTSTTKEDRDPNQHHIEEGTTPPVVVELDPFHLVSSLPSKCNGKRRMGTTTSSPKSKVSHIPRSASKSISSFVPDCIANTKQAMNSATTKKMITTSSTSGGRSKRQHEEETIAVEMKHASVKFMEPQHQQKTASIDVHKLVDDRKSDQLHHNQSPSLTSVRAKPFIATKQGFSISDDCRSIASTDTKKSMRGLTQFHRKKATMRANGQGFTSDDNRSITSTDTRKSMRSLTRFTGKHAPMRAFKQKQRHKVKDPAVETQRRKIKDSMVDKRFNVQDDHESRNNVPNTNALLHSLSKDVSFLKFMLCQIQNYREMNYRETASDSDSTTSDSSASERYSVVETEEDSMINDGCSIAGFLSLLAGNDCESNKGLGSYRQPSKKKLYSV